MWMRACECCIKVSGVYRQSGYIYTNYDLLVMHAIYCDIIVFKYVRPDTTENGHHGPANNFVDISI